MVGDERQAMADAMRDMAAAAAAAGGEPVRRPGTERGMAPTAQVRQALARLTALLDRVEGIENTVRSEERKELWRQIGRLCAVLAPRAGGPQ